MKKSLIFAVILALLLPAAAFAATEFTLGGFIKMDSFWDSTQQGKNINGVISRNNINNGFHHGNLRFTAQGSRFNFTIKGPKVFGAQTTGFIEMDFDEINGANASASQVYTPRLRHAMFRLNWPDTELLMGQYWSTFCSWYAESTEDGPLQMTGTPTARLPQIRVTQKFLGDWSVMGLVGMANHDGDIGAGSTYSLNSTNGSAAETPQVQASLKYNHDWWGKAAYYGVPVPFTAQLSGGWQRNIARAQNIVGTPIDGTFNAGLGGRISNTYLDPWMAMGTLFIPVIPTHSANLAGTASILTQFWIGKGVEVFGFSGDDTSILKVNAFTPDQNAATNNTLFDIEMVNRWGGFVQGQYYFTNQWYANVAWGLTHTFGVEQTRANINGVNSQEYFYSNPNGQISSMNQFNATLWYRPVTALKFGLQYSFVQNNFWTRTNGAGANVVGPAATTLSNSGTAHRVEFAGYFYF
jgi:hypothetical protein